MSARLPRIAVLADRLAELSETFVVGEVRALRRLGHAVTVEDVSRPVAPAALDEPALIWVFSRRSAVFRALLAGAAVAATRRSALPLATGLPYLALVGRGSRVRTGVVYKRVAAVVMAGNAVGGVSLVRGSLAARTPLL